MLFTAISKIYYELTVCYALFLIVCQVIFNLPKIYELGLLLHFNVRNTETGKHCVTFFFFWGVTFLRTFDYEVADLGLEYSTPRSQLQDCGLVIKLHQCQCWGWGAHTQQDISVEIFKCKIWGLLQKALCLAHSVIIHNYVLNIQNYLNELRKFGINNRSVRK